MFASRSNLRVVLIALVTIASAARGQYVEPFEADAEATAAFETFVTRLRERPAITVRSTLTIELVQDDVATTSDEVVAEFTASRGPGARRTGRGIVKINEFVCWFQPDRGRIGQGDGTGSFTAVHERNDTAYFRNTYDGSPYWALLDAFRSLPYPHLALFWGEDSIDDVAMQIHAETPWIVPTAVEVVTREDGRTVQRITLSSPNATLALDVEPERGLLAGALHEITGGNIVAPGTIKRTRYRFEYEVFDAPLPDDRILFDPGDRQSVDFLASLVPPAPAAEPRGGGGNAAGAARVGAPAPEFTLATMDGNAIDLADLRGHVVVLDFWATWCGPCRRALPELHRVAEWARTEQLPVSVVTINVYEARNPAQNTPDARLAAAIAFWRENGFTLPVAMDFTDETGAAYGVSGIPTTVIIRADGIVHAMHSGAGPDYADMLRREIESAIEAFDGD